MTGRPRKDGAPARYTRSGQKKAAKRKYKDPIRTIDARNNFFGDTSYKVGAAGHLSRIRMVYEIDAITLPSVVRELVRMRDNVEDERVRKLIQDDIDRLTKPEEL